MSDFPWPKDNAKLFTADGEYYEHAHFAWGDWDTTFVGYINGYKHAADCLVSSVIESQEIEKLDTCVYPILFLYRQYIEFRLSRN